MDTNFSGKLGVLFAPKTTFLDMFPAFTMVNLKKHQIWVPWVITKILMCQVPGFEEKRFSYLFSMVVFDTLAIRKYFHKLSKFYRSSAMVKTKKLLQKLIFLWQWKSLVSTWSHSVVPNFFEIYLSMWKITLDPSFWTKFLGNIREENWFSFLL